MKNTFLIFISSAIRAYEYPRIDGFVHTTEFKDVVNADGKPLGERYVYLGRELTIDEFNAAAARVFSPTFAGEERSFQPLAIGPAAAGKIAAPVAVTAPILEFVESSATAIGNYLAVKDTHPIPSSTDAPAPAPAPEFTLDDKAILMNGERIAGLFGEDKQLRVLSAHSDLRPAIEAWLATQ